MINLFHMKDATIAYKSIHGRDTLHPQLRKHQIEANFEVKENPYIFNSEFDKQLRSLDFPNSQVAPFSWWSRFVIINVLLIWSEYNYRFNPGYLKSVIMGVTYALIGLNIGHDASHGAVSKNARVNEIVAHYMDIIGNNSISWFKQHVIQHHGNTNESKADPDTVGGEPFLFFNKENKKHDYGVFFTPVLSLLGFAYIFGVMRVFKVPEKYLRTAILWRLFLWYRLFWPMLESFNMFRVLNFLLVVLFSGGTLSFLFVVSHNTTRTKRNALKSSNDWYKNQVETSCTYGGKIAGYITGGLNYQIEHHCFPRMNSMYYSRIHDKLRLLCKKHDVNYVYYDSYLENFKDTLLWINL